MMSEELSAYKAQAIAQDRLNTLASVLFDDADLSWNGELNFSGGAIRPFLKAWFPEAYCDTVNALKEKQEQKEAEERRAKAREEAIERANKRYKDFERIDIETEDTNNE